MLAVQARQANLNLWSRWVVTNTLGACIGWVVAVALGFVTFGGGLLIAGPIVGIGIGTAQTLFLEHYFPNNKWSNWLYITTVGATLFWIVFALTQWLFAQQDRALLYHPLGLIGSFLMGGAMFGLVQWAVLRKNVQKAGWWIFANSIGWSIGGALGSITGDGVVRLFYDRDNPYAGRLIWFPEYIFVFVAGTVATVIFAAVTGAMLLRLSPRINFTDSRT